MIMDLFIIGTIEGFKLFNFGYIPIFILDFLFSIVLMYFLNDWLDQVDIPEQAKGIMIGAALYMPAIALFPMMLYEPTFKTYLREKL